MSNCTRRRHATRFSLMVLTTAVAMSGCTARTAEVGGPWPARQELLGSAARIPCETAVLDVGDTSWRRLLSGFHGDETWHGEGDPRSFAWAGPVADVSLLFAEAGPREIVLTARGVLPVVTVTASLDGRDLGTRRIPGLWSQVSWPIPADVAAPGPHRLRLISKESQQTGSDPRTLSIAVDRIELTSPAQCAGQQQAAGFGGVDSADGIGGRELVLAGGQGLVVPVSLPPMGRVEVEVTGSPEALLEGYVVHGGGVEPLGFASARGAAESTGGRRLELPVPNCCRPEAALVLVARTEEGVRITGLAIEGDPRAPAWRRACRLPSKEAAVAVVLLAAASLGIRELRRRGAVLAEPPPVATAWRDAAVIAAVAVAVRLLFLEVYPEPGRSADAYEYLMRSARLAEGRVSFLHDTSWHAWQTWSRPPGYYLFLAAVQRLGGDLRAVLTLHAVACGIAAGATYLAACRLFGWFAGWVAGISFALYGESVVTFSRILSEPFYMVFVVPGLAALTWAAVRPSARLAASAGVLLGLAALVRSTPVWYLPLAALALLAAIGPRRGWRPVLVLIGSFAMVVTPWVLRNSMIAGAPGGIDNLVAVNLLQVRPNDRFVLHSDLDLDTPQGQRAYYTRLKKSNFDGALSSRGGEILRAILVDLAADPGAALMDFGKSVNAHFAPYAFDFFSRTHREDDLCRVRWVTDALNAQHVVLLVLGGVGLLLTARDPRSWPLVLWFFLNNVIINLFFFPEPRFRLPTMPVVMIWSGAAVAILVQRVVSKSPNSMKG